MKNKIMNWMKSKNKFFSSIDGEAFSNAEVVFSFIGIVVFIILTGIIGGLEHM